MRLYCVQARNFASLTYQDLDMPLLEIIFCLKSIKEIKLYLVMLFRDSEGSYSGTMMQTFQLIS